MVSMSLSATREMSTTIGFEDFGDWASQASGNSADEDFCGDTRNDILNRDLDDVEYKDDDECQVVAGSIHDPYTGAKFDFERGPGDKSYRVQIDHMFALGAAMRTRC